MRNMTSPRALFAAALVVMLACVATLSLWPDPKLPESDMTVIVSRTDDTIELFWKTDLSHVTQIFGTDPTIVPELRRLVDPAARGAGTFDLAERIMSRAQLRQEATTLAIEGMSLMVHTPEIAVAYQTPLDALISIEVCNIIDTASLPSTAPLDVHAGFVAYDVAGTDALTLELPYSGADALTLTLLDYVNGARTEVRQIDLGQDTAITLDEYDGSLTTRLRRAVSAL